jgi:hypothetical protein
MTTVNEIVRTFGSEYTSRYGSLMPHTHRKVIDAMIACRTPLSGIAIYQCEQCGRFHEIYRSCGNRHCPTCQQKKTQLWREKQIDRQLPGHHFLLTFTVPDKLRRFIRKNQRHAYAALFRASSQAIKKLALDERHIGGDLPGFFGVLHTWGRTLEYHPHIHYIVTGGALSSRDGLWHPSRIDFYLPVRALSVIFKAKFRDAMEEDGLLDQISPEVWQSEWNVNCQAVGPSERSLKYLAPYVFKVALSNSRIVGITGRTVFIRYRKSHSHRDRILALDVMEFIRRFLQHVLPTGFMKVRYYGFMNPNCGISLDRIRTLIELSDGFDAALPQSQLQPWPSMACPTCGGLLRLRALLLPSGALLRAG